MATKSELTRGGCYCATGLGPILTAQCHCRPCQHITSGGPNYFMLIPTEGVVCTHSTPRAIAHPGLDIPVTREFCATSATHLVARLPEQPLVAIKVGTLDAPFDYGGPKMAIYCLEN